jgi:hypothetical protein
MPGLIMLLSIVATASAVTSEAYHVALLTTGIFLG